VARPDPPLDFPAFPRDLNRQNKIGVSEWSTATQTEAVDSKASLSESAPPITKQKKEHLAVLYKPFCGKGMTVAQERTRSSWPRIRARPAAQLRPLSGASLRPLPRTAPLRVAPASARTTFRVFSWASQKKEATLRWPQTYFAQERTRTFTPRGTST
jgi:hypothetical protein